MTGFETSSPIPGLLVIELTRPTRFNAFTNTFFTSFQSLMTSIRHDTTTKVVLIHGGKSRHFSSGLDVSDPTLYSVLKEGEDCGLTSLSIRKLVQNWQESISSLESCLKPVIVCVHGFCIGAAVDLITSCDVRLCTRDTVVSIRETKLGMAADLGTLQRIMKVCGNSSLVHEWVYTGRNVEWGEVEKSGLMSRGFETREEMMEYAMSLCQRIIKIPLVALVGSKRSLLYARDHSVQDGLDQIAEWNGAMLQSNDVRRAFQSRSKL